MPAFANSKVGSSCGIVDEEGTNVCSYFSTKKSTNICRRSFADKLGSIVEREGDEFFDSLRKTIEFNEEMNRFAPKYRLRIMKISRKSCNPWYSPLAVFENASLVNINAVFLNMVK